MNSTEMEHPATIKCAARMHTNINYDGISGRAIEVAVFSEVEDGRRWLESQNLIQRGLTGFYVDPKGHQMSDYYELVIYPNPVPVNPPMTSKPRMKTWVVSLGRLKVPFLYDKSIRVRARTEDEARSKVEYDTAVFFVISVDTLQSWKEKYQRLWRFQPSNSGHKETGLS